MAVVPGRDSETSQDCTLFLPAVYPPQSELEHAKVKLSQLRDGISTMNQRITEIDILINSLQKERRELGANICDHEITIFKIDSSTRPFLPSRIPHEIISRIFLEFFEDKGNPWTLVQICRAWRWIAFDTLRLWSKIVIKIGSTPFTRNSCGWEYCANESQLQAALQRARNVPLDLELDYNPDQERSEVVSDSDEADAIFSSNQKIKQEKAVFWSMMEIVKDHIHKCKELVIDICLESDPRWETFLKSCSVMPKNTEIPKTKQTINAQGHLNGSHNEDALDWSLRTLTLSGFDSHLLALLEPKWLKKIQTLVYYGDTVDLLGIILTCTSLNRLELPGYEDYTDTHEPSAIPTSLRELAINLWSSSLNDYLVPTLLHLEIKAVGPTEKFSPRQLEFPHLRYLAIQQVQAIKAIVYFQCPMLITMRLQRYTALVGESISELLSSLQENKCKLNPKVLELVDVGISQEHLKTLLQCMNNIEHLFCTGHPQPETFWLSLTDSNELISPRLKSLTIDQPQKADTTAYEAILQMIDARGHLNLPIRLEVLVTPTEDSWSRRYRYQSGVIR